MREGLVFEVADHQLDRGVVAVIDIGGERRNGAVGHERVVAPVGEQLGLGAHEPRASDGQPPVPEWALSDLRLADVGMPNGRFLVVPGLSISTRLTGRGR